MSERNLDGAQSPVAEKWRAPIKEALKKLPIKNKVLGRVEDLRTYTSPEKRFYVYAHFLKDGTPYYIGKGSGKRIAAHKWEGVETGAFTLAVGLTEEQAFEVEKKLIEGLVQRFRGSTHIMA